MAVWMFVMIYAAYQQAILPYEEGNSATRQCIPPCHQSSDVMSSAIARPSAPHIADQA